jgi:hypothetical protein
MILILVRNKVGLLKRIIQVKIIIKHNQTFLNIIVIIIKVIMEYIIIVIMEYRILVEGKEVVLYNLLMAQYNRV